jgi:EpsI family protein
MRNSLKSGVLMGALMFGTVGLAAFATPTIRVAELRPSIDLETAIPKQFGEWEEDRNQVAAVVNPATVAELNKIYAQTLSRTYVNHAGERIMLSIAYGTDQSDNLSVHFPEGCYGGQGFSVTPTVRGMLDTSAGPIPTARLVAAQYNRNEPITYWIVVGERAVYDAWQLKKAKLGYALKRQIPDATLMRISNVTVDNEAGYKLQQKFLNEMLAAMTPDHRRHFSGTGQ